MVPLLNSEMIDPVAFKYVNRLSDYLFMLARIYCMLEGQEETIYKKARKRGETEEEKKE